MALKTFREDPRRARLEKAMAPKIEPKVAPKPVIETKSTPVVVSEEKRTKFAKKG